MHYIIEVDGVNKQNRGGGIARPRLLDLLVFAVFLGWPELHAAVHPENLAADVRGLIRGQEGDRGGNLLRSAVPLQRPAFHHLLRICLPGRSETSMGPSSALISAAIRIPSIRSKAIEEPGPEQSEEDSLSLSPCCEARPRAIGLGEAELSAVD